MASIFVAKGVNVADMPKDYEDDDVCKAIDDCRDFAVSGGVAECVLSRVDDRSKYKVMSINGIDSKVVRQIKLWPKIKPDADLVEIMCCYGGCVAGPGTFNSVPNALKMREAQKKARHEAWESKEKKEE